MFATAWQSIIIIDRTAAHVSKNESDFTYLLCVHLCVGALLLLMLLAAVPVWTRVNV